jgi:hypothetical protein
MDLNQSKLTKSEWQNLEISVSDEEKRILKLIADGYDNINIRYNDNDSLITTMKIEYTPEIETYLFKEYFEKEIRKTIEKYIGKIPELAEINLNVDTDSGTSKKHKQAKSKTKGPNSADMIRISSMAKTVEAKRPTIFEFTLIDFCKSLIETMARKQKNCTVYLYTLLQLRDKSNTTVTSSTVSIPHINQYVSAYVNTLTELASKKISVREAFQQSYENIEKNPNLLKYGDITLYSHQQDLFSICKQTPDVPKLILYMAPTGTGKTLSPLGLSKQYKILFVCVARHVGLALAKAAISMEKKVAFAFGCTTASDIRLHYFAASTYTKHRKSGGIGKVDNSVGDRVEIMICDVQSYLTAMYYMLAFNSEESIITYWDEPTITMDYETHPLHETVHRNWTENKISKVILSCATLPKENEISRTLQDFRLRFTEFDKPSILRFDEVSILPEIHTVTSFDCRKTISILNKDGKSVLPHLLFSNYREALACAEHCEQNKTLLRYFDLAEIVRFCEYVNDNNMIDERDSINTRFKTISDITMDSIKTYYLDVLKHIDSEKWPEIFQYMTSSQKMKFANRPALVQSNQAPPGTNITTSDAYTLTDGPTIYLVNDVNKIGQFCVHQSNIPEAVFANIMNKIEENERIRETISILQKSMEDSLAPDAEKDKKAAKEQFNPAVKLILDKIEAATGQIQMVQLESRYIPNTIHHQQKWAPNGDVVKNAYVSQIEEEHIKEIMEVDVSSQLKILLLMGIGLFEETPNIQYMELIKRLAYEQKLYLIIASSDYIYGTNYQFCHGFIGKDLTNMTQQKTIQAMGRIGRNNIQQEYTIRFRDDTILANLFKPVEHNLEAINMSELFCG